MNGQIIGLTDISVEKSNQGLFFCFLFVIVGPRERVCYDDAVFPPHKPFYVLMSRSESNFFMCNSAEPILEY